MFGLSTLTLKLIAFGVLSAVVVAAFIGFVAHERNIGAARQKEEDAPIIKAAEDRAKRAEDANAQFKKDYGVLEKACAKSAASVNEFKRQREEAVAASAALLARQEQNELETTARVAQLQARAAKSISEVCDAKAADLRSIAADLLRWEPAVAGTNP